MLKNTFIARASDGLILCETYDSVSDSQVEKLKHNAKQLLKKLSSNANHFSCTLDIDDHCFHYSIHDGIVYLTIAEQKYPQKLAFLFLKDVHDCFQEELKNTYGTSGGVDYLSKIETIENSYSFLKFEKVIAKKRKEFRDSSAKENIDKLNQELIDIKNIMHENFDMILNRDKNLNKISQMSSDLKDNSKKFRKDAKKLRLTMWLRKYATFIAIGGGHPLLQGPNNDGIVGPLKQIGKPGSKLPPTSQHQVNSYQATGKVLPSNLKSALYQTTNVVPAATTSSGVLSNEVVGGNVSQNKSRRLRKNFDLLAHALAQTKQHTGLKLQSSKRRQRNGSENNSRNAAFENVYLGGNAATAAGAHHNDSHHNQSVLSNLGGNSSVMIGMFEENKAHTYGSSQRSEKVSQPQLGYYENLQKQRLNLVQSQRNGGSVKQAVAPLISNGANSSLFSQISLKADSPQKNKSMGAPFSRNQGAIDFLMFQQNNMLNGTTGQANQYQTQPLVFNQQHIVTTKKTAQDKLIKKYIHLGGGTTVTGQQLLSQPNRKLKEQSLLNILPQSTANSGASAQGGNPILNINSASDINIYNNSFIVNTSSGTNQSGLYSKKQAHSQNQSRSSSLKRNAMQQMLPNGSQVQLAAQELGYNPQFMMRKQIANGKFVNINSAGGGMNSYDNRINNDYLTKEPSVNQRSSRKLSSTASVNGADKKYEQIAEAYTAQNFFGGSNSALSQYGGSFRIQGGKTSSIQKKQQPINLKRKHSKQSSSSNSSQHHLSTQQQLHHNLSLGNNQNLSGILQYPNYTQLLDIQPLNSSKDLQQSFFNHQPPQLSSSSGKKLHLMNTQTRSKIKFVNNNRTRNNNGGQQQQSQSLNRLFSQKQQENSYNHSSPDINVNNNTASQRVNRLMAIGKKRVLEGEYQKAIHTFNEVLQLETDQQDAKYYKAICLLDSGNVKEAIQVLNDIVSQKSNAHSPVCHILLSIAYNRNNEQQASLQVLNTCIKYYPTYPDAYQARGQALLLLEKFSEGLNDFKQFTSLIPKNGMGHMGVGDSHKALRQWKQAISAYTIAIQLFERQAQDSMKRFIVQATLKRGLSLYHLKDYDKAMNDFKSTVKQEETCVKAHFYIGKILAKQCEAQLHNQSLQNSNHENNNNYQLLQNEAILHFEQVVKHHTPQSEVYAGNALFEIAKLRLNDKDFYEAYFNLKRAVDSNFNSKRLQLYKDFTEGVLYLIKRKIKKGVQILSDLLEILVNNNNKKDQKQLNYLKHQSYLYRAYGYVAIEKYEVALQDIKKAKKISKLDAPTIYNKLLSKGILRMDHEDYLMATKYFNKASAKFPSNKDPYCLYIISIVRSYAYSHQGMSIDQEEKRERIMHAKVFLDTAITNCNMKVQVPSLYFFRGMLYFQLHMFYQALQDFNVAIDIEEEPTASYFLARGRTYACLSILTEAMKDLSIALNLDEALEEAYIYRGKCAYLLGDNNLAFLDFQRLILTDPKNSMVHVYAGNLLMTTGAYQDAIKAFMNADTVEKTAIAAFQRARCYCALTDLENAKMQFKIAMQLCKKEELVQIDSSIITSLMRVINASQQTTKNEQSKKNIQQAIQQLTELISLFQSEKIKCFTKKDCSLNIQIIPNVKRIKVEKIQAAKDLLLNQAEEQKLPDLSLATEDVLNQPTIDLDTLKDIPLHSYYYENVFSTEDLFLFRAVYHFYNQDYLKAIEDYEHCSILKSNSDSPHKNGGCFSRDHMAESLMAYSQGSTPMLSMNSSKTDLSDVGLCSLNIHETNFNIILCYLMIQDYNSALDKIKEIISSAPGKYQKHFFFFRGLIYEQLGQNEKAQKDFQRFQKIEPKVYESYFNEGNDVLFEPFPVKNRLCSRFETIPLVHLGTGRLVKGKRPKILSRPSFSMPFIKPPNMIPNIDEESIQNEFTLKQIDAPMPEAPWIRRWGNAQDIDIRDSIEGGIKFTDNILMQDEEEEEEQEDSKSSFQMPQMKKKSEVKVKEKSKEKIGAPQMQNQQKKQTDESPYIQSIEVQPQSKQQPQAFISEHLIKAANSQNNTSNIHSVNNSLVNPMMVYQFANIGSGASYLYDVDQLSDKHKISLFDDSRYEPDDSITGQLQHLRSGGCSLEIGRSIDANPAPRILKTKKGGEDQLAGGDSLYDEHLLNQIEDAEEINHDSSSNSAEEDQDESSGSEEEEETGANQKPAVSSMIIGSSGPTAPPQQVGDSMVLMADTHQAIKKQRAQQKQLKKKQRKRHSLQLTIIDKQPQQNRYDVGTNQDAMAYSQQIVQSTDQQ